MSSVLSVYCRGLPASKNDQLCMPLNMYICAFVYSIGVHWYFSFSSQWFTKKIKAATFPYFLTAKLGWCVDERDLRMASCVTSPQISFPPPDCQPINTVCLVLPSQRGTLPFGTSEYLNPFTVKPSGRRTADWWSRITRRTDTENRHLVEILQPEREREGCRRGEREESLNAGLGWTPSLLMTQRHVLGAGGWRD